MRRAGAGPRRPHLAHPIRRGARRGRGAGHASPPARPAERRGARGARSGVAPAGPTRARALACVAPRRGGGQALGTASAQAAALVASSDVRRLEQAVELLRTGRRRAQLPGALLALGREQRHAGQRRAARTTSARPWPSPSAWGPTSSPTKPATSCAWGARPRRDDLVGPASLTRRSGAWRRATEAPSNREIAARLFLSPKIVEMHLGRVYRKLDIHYARRAGRRPRWTAGGRAREIGPT